MISSGRPCDVIRAVSSGSLRCLRRFRLTPPTSSSAQCVNTASKERLSTATSRAAISMTSFFGRSSSVLKRSRFRSTYIRRRRRSRSSQPRTRETSRQGSQPCFLLRAEGWHIETAIHVLRLVLSGAFDQYPGLQLIIGHLDETLPFMLPRLEVGLPLQVTKLDRPISAYLRENVHDTFSGFNFTATFLDLLLDRRRTDYVLCRLSLQLDDRGTDFPRQASGEPCRQRADRARQRGAPCATVIRMTDFCANRVSGPLN